jgi:sugar O-acyltransferase (sialic acid O-acetyltransferase NeuD family)
MKKILIFGASGMAREAGEIAYLNGYSPIYIVRDKAEFDGWIFEDDAVLEADVWRYKSLPFVIGIGENAARQRIVTRFADEINYVNLIHPTATFGRGQRELIEKRRGIIIAAGVRLTNNIQVGDFSIINQNATVAHDVVIGEYVHISPLSCISGNVLINSLSWIGAGAVINQGQKNEKLEIGKATIIGSGTIVLTSCEPYSVYVGNPARKIK